MVTGAVNVKTFWLVILALIMIPLLVWSGWRGAKRVAWFTPPGREIALVVRGAVSVSFTGFTPPQAYRNVRMSRPRFVAFGDSAQQRLTQFYTGKSLTLWRRIARSVLNPRDFHNGKNSEWMTNWRVDWVHLGELGLLPGSSTATATASVEVRSNGGALNRMDYTFSLVKTAAGWRIQSEDWQFEPGYEP